MRQLGRVVCVMSAGLMLSGCYGPFTLTKKVHQWNGEVSDNKWVVEGVFLLCAWLPVYGIATAADALIFNSVIFWTGQSWLDEGSSMKRSKKASLNGTEITLTRLGSALMVDQQQGDQHASVKLEPRNGQLAAVAADGTVLLRAQTMPDGTILITKADGTVVTSHTSEEVDRLLASRAQ